MIQWAVAGILINDNGKVLIAKRPEGKPLAGFWEFPGGKIESHETSEAALCRELNEELDIEVDPRDLAPITFLSTQYNSKPIVLLVFHVKKWTNDPKAVESQEISWITPHMLNDYQLIPANFDVIDPIIQLTTR